MIASRTISRTAVRAARPARPLKYRQARFQSTQASGNASGGTSPALIGGIAGGSVALIGCYTWYSVSGAKKLVNAAHDTKAYVQSAQKKLVENAPQPNEALKWLRQVTSYYAGFVPGASSYVDTAFNDFDKIHEKHHEEVDQIVKEAYDELKGLSNEELSFTTATKTWDILQKHVKRIGDLAGDALEDILNNHPEIKKKVGGNLDQLKGLGDKFGPEAKKQVEDTWNQIRDITKNGFNSETAEKIYKLVQEKTEQVKKLGDEAWKKGLEKAKPYLDKNPQVKEIVEKNADALKQGNFEKVYEQIKSAVESGSTEDLEKFAKNAANTAKQQGGAGFEHLIKSIPGGDQVLPKLQQLQQVAEKHGDEAKKLLEETVQEISQVLSKKADKAKKIADKAK